MSGIEAAELAVQRNLTAAFIAADWMMVALERRTRTADGEGGYLEGPAVPLAAQRMRLIPRQDGSVERMTADGKVVLPAYSLMGSHDADMERWDEFEVNGHRYQVVFINQNRQYEVKGEVAYLA
jgi:hypothetical protein